MEETQAILANNLMYHNWKTSLDTACKRLLSNKIMLAWILKSCTSEFANCSVEEIITIYLTKAPSISKEAVHMQESDDAVTFDICFQVLLPETEDKAGVFANIEPQQNFYPGYPLVTRGIYYGSRLISSQYGSVFKKSQYGKLQKVYSIWICLKPSKEKQNSITKYELQETTVCETTTVEKSDYDLMSVVMIYLGNPEETKVPILRLLGTLLSNEIDARNKIRVLEDEFGIPMTGDLREEILEMCDIGEGLWNEAMEFGIQQGIKCGLEQGMEQGMERGLEQGMERGIEQEHKNLLKQLLSVGAPMDLIRQITTLPEVEIYKLRDTH